MKYKIFIGILLIFLMISVVNAKDINDITAEDILGIDYFDKATVVEIDGFNFTIPEGFGQIEGYDINSTEDGVTTHSMFFSDENGEVIMLSTVTGDDISLNLDDYNIYKNTTKESIKGHEGLKFEDEGYKFFNYIDGDAVIILQAPEYDYFESIISD